LFLSLSLSLSLCRALVSRHQLPLSPGEMTPENHSAVKKDVPEIYRTVETIK
jgi:hypothetical protein